MKKKTTKKITKNQTVKVEMFIDEVRKLFWVSIGTPKEIKDFQRLLDNTICDSKLWK